MRTIKKLLGVAAVSAALVSMSACGSATATGSTSPLKAMGVAEAGEYYLDVVNETNATEDEFLLAAYTDNLTAVTEEASKTGAAYKTAAEKMAAKKWPKKVENVAEKLRREFANDAKMYEEASEATDVEGINAALEDQGNTGSSGLMRSRLGLPKATKHKAPFTIVEYKVGKPEYGSRDLRVTLKNNCPGTLSDIGLEIGIVDSEGTTVDTAYLTSSGKVEEGKNIIVDGGIDESDIGSTKGMKLSPASITFMNDAGNPRQTDNFLGSEDGKI